MISKQKHVMAMILLSNFAPVLFRLLFAETNMDE